MITGPELSVAITGGVGLCAIYIMRRIALKIEKRLEQVEDHELRITVIETLCDSRHDGEHSKARHPGYCISP